MSKKEPTIQTVAELQTISTLFLDNKIVFCVEETGNWYFWDKDSALTEDEVFVIKPVDVGTGNGRFVALSGSVRRGTSEEDVPSGAAPPLTKIWWVNPFGSAKAVWLAVSTAANGWMRVNSLTNP